MKTILIILLTALSLPASNEREFVKTDGKIYMYYGNMPQMASCPFSNLIGGMVQKCYGTGVCDGKRMDGYFHFHCNINPNHEWISS